MKKQIIFSIIKFTAKLLFISAFSTLGLLTSCSYFTSTDQWNYQKITVQTEPRGAYCHLHNDRASWLIKSTPMTFNVHRSKVPLLISCQKPGYATVTQSISSQVPLMAPGDLEPNYYPTAEDYNYYYPNVIQIVLPVAPSFHR